MGPPLPGTASRCVRVSGWPRRRLRAVSLPEAAAARVHLARFLVAKTVLPAGLAGAGLREGRSPLPRALTPGGTFLGEGTPGVTAAETSRGRGAVGSLSGPTRALNGRAFNWPRHFRSIPQFNTLKGTGVRGAETPRPPPASGNRERQPPLSPGRRWESPRLPGSPPQLLRHLGAWVVGPGVGDGGPGGKASDLPAAPHPTPSPPSFSAGQREGGERESGSGEEQNRDF